MGLCCSVFSSGLHTLRGVNNMECTVWLVNFLSHFRVQDSVSLFVPCLANSETEIFSILTGRSDFKVLVLLSHWLVTLLTSLHASDLLYTAYPPTPRPGPQAPTRPQFPQLFTNSFHCTGPVLFLTPCFQLSSYIFWAPNGASYPGNLPDRPREMCLFPGEPLPAYSIIFL